LLNFWAPRKIILKEFRILPKEDTGHFPENKKQILVWIQTVGFGGFNDAKMVVCDGCAYNSALFDTFSRKSD
jgi:hypothetical protein